jgi:hypothetical protein
MQKSKIEMDQLLKSVQRQPMLVNRRLTVAEVGSSDDFNIKLWAEQAQDTAVQAIAEAVGQNQAAWATSLLPSYGERADPEWRLVLRVYWLDREAEIMYRLRFGVS